MRWIIVLSILLSLFIFSGCSISTEIDTTNFHNISEFNKVKLIDFPYEIVDDREIQSIDEVFQNENKASAIYRKTLDLFPRTQPFSSVIIQESYQINLIEELYAKYQLNMPETNWYKKVSTFENLYQACSASLVFSQNSVDLYSILLDHEGFDYLINNEDLRFLYTKIRDDYQNTYIPIFKKCVRKLK